ncbi:MAG: hypothetical protein HYV28_04825 [Ignavibacteriales bacterium]|nr:hypothetical protein [Ignavibacteriales bacterium]
MLKFLSTIILFSYLIGLLAPFAPLVEYYANLTYIKENLCEKKDEPESDCCGKCYLKKQIVKEEKKEVQQPLQLKEGKNTDHHLTLSLQKNCQPPAASFSMYYHVAEKAELNTIQPETPPPRNNY